MVQIDEVRLFYANLQYVATQERSKVCSIVNGCQFGVDEYDLGEHALQPYSSIRIERCESIESLPFSCSREEFWETLTSGFDPKSEEKILLVDLNPLALMIVKVIQRNVYPRAGTPSKAYFQVLVAAFCILRKCQVN